jgi:DNA polymerase alpha subunit B
MYEPLRDLVDVLHKTNPHVCILVGPFLDASHPLLESGEVVLESTFEDMFTQQMEDLSKSLKDKHVNTQVVLVSSPREAHHYPIYPSPPYDISK